MRLGVYDTGMDSAGNKGVSATRSRRFPGMGYAEAMQEKSSHWMQVSSRINAIEEEASEKPEKAVRDRAAKIYEAAVAGKENPISKMRTASKVPYGHLAKDGVIEYNGIVFVCDPKTNSICLGNVEDKSQVITVALSGGGHLKVNRKNLGDLSRAAGMFSPEDLNLIMRAIAQDTKIQSVKKEIDDMENSVGSAESAVSGEAEEQNRRDE